MQSPYVERVIERAQRDEAFRQQLLDDPRGAISADLGVDVPDGIEIRVIEEDPEEAVIVLPAPTQPAQVTDAQLSEVVGGAGSIGLGSWSWILRSATL
jgi:hypothetical protein